ncbi:MAG TPA: tRNA (pseudouridine(54)-N(1))-methyltransferase TrmY [Archaeoglobus profundus]|nr:tRNA (pseudouridine(54)-N(1))-methyltransferase TrmY [Archaeoglobus profundus]HIP57686.1 tRNA (pseudouridine(54)-N(1))-methyltransferase TrmY [Archaeoglobus profundus]
MRGFLVIGNKAVTKPFSLKDLAGSAGRMDILCRCVAQAMFISHGIRRDSEIYLLLLGEPDPPKALKILGIEVRYMAPDERNIGGLIRKALSIKVNKDWKISTPGIYIARKNLKDLLDELSSRYDQIIYLREDGVDIREVVSKIRNPLFILGDHIGVREEDEKLILKYADMIISLSPLSLQADQCIVIVHYELDRITYKK